MSLLSLVQSAARRVGIPSPNVVATATDATVLLMLELAQEEGRQLARYGDWRALRKEKTFTTVAAETQTDTPIPTDFAGFIDGTFWNRSRRERLFGPATAQEWQSWKSQSTFPIYGTFYLRGTSLLIQPTPTAGETVAYEYRSSYWCQSSGGTAQEAWAADTDTGILSEYLMALGLIWRFKQTRGMEWQPDFSKYEFEVQQALSADQPRRILNMSQGGLSVDPIRGVTTPEGYWSL
jgi:hypothetical protein